MEHGESPCRKFELLLLFLILKYGFWRSGLRNRATEEALIVRHRTSVQIFVFILSLLEVIIRCFEHPGVWGIQVEIDQLPPADGQTVSQRSTLQMRLPEGLTVVSDTLAELLGHFANGGLEFIPELPSRLQF